MGELQSLKALMECKFSKDRNHLSYSTVFNTRTYTWHTAIA